MKNPEYATNSKKEIPLSICQYINENKVALTYKKQCNSKCNVKSAGLEYGTQGRLLWGQFLRSQKKDKTVKRRRVSKQRWCDISPWSAEDSRALKFRNTAGWFFLCEVYKI